MIGSVSTKLDQFIETHKETDRKQDSINGKVDERLQSVEKACAQNSANYGSLKEDIGDVKKAQDSTNAHIEDLKGEINVTFKAAVKSIKEDADARLRMWITIIALGCTILGIVIGLITA
jgi:chromosome segregation ATPase